MTYLCFAAGPAWAFPSLRDLLPGQSAAAQEEVASHLQTLLSAERIEAGSIVFPTIHLREFYAAREFAPVWASQGRLTAKTQKALQYVSGAAAQALPAARYGLEAIAAIEKEEATELAQKTALLELLSAHALLRYAEDVHNGLAAPAYSLEGKASGAALLKQIAEANDVEAFMAKLPPQDHAYSALKLVYAELKTKPAGEWPVVAAGASIKPGMSDARMPGVRKLLLLTGDLPAHAIPDDPVLDPLTQEALAAFQRRHGLNADGAVGKQTLTALNTPPSARLGQIAATMERLRWQPEQMPERYVLVNVPGYTLRAFDTGAEALAMRVIVGEKKNATPLFHNVINQVVFNPTWTIPKGIAVKEMLAKIRENPDYLSQHNYRVLQRGDGGMQAVDPWEVDWDSLSERHFPYTLRQDAGDDNALGKVKFNIPNSGAIYLHDTANPKLFAKDFRALSHGCIRLEKPRDMAHYILGPSDLGDEKINAYYDSETPRTLKAEETPLYLVYWTALVGKNGTQFFYPDIYGLDAELAKKLGV